MKRIAYFLIIASSVVLWPSCVKKAICEDKSVQSEQSDVLGYASAQGMTGTLHSSGLYYQIINQGTGPTPNLNSGIMVKYTGRLVSNNQIFEQQTNPVGPLGLGGLILGWQIALPLIQKGGKIQVILPSSLAYGCTGFGSVPGNAVLFFEIELVDVL